MLYHLSQTLASLWGTLAVDRTYIGSEQQRRGISTQRSSGRRGSEEPPKRQPPAEASSAPRKGAKSPTTTSPDAACESSSFPAALKRRRHRLEVEETQEQLVAVARGGVRYAGKVFHRRGVKLTEDSPRSMIPRDVSRSIFGSSCADVIGASVWLSHAAEDSGKDARHVKFQRGWMPLKPSRCRCDLFFFIYFEGLAKGCSWRHRTFFLVPKSTARVLKAQSIRVATF